MDKGKVLGGPYEAKPATPDPSKYRRDQEEEEPDHDYKNDYPPVDGVPDESEIKQPEKSRSKQ